MVVIPEIEVYCPNGHLSIQTNISNLQKLHSLIDLGCQICDSSLSIKTINSNKLKLEDFTTSSDNDQVKEQKLNINWEKITNNKLEMEDFFLTNVNRSYTEDGVTNLPKVSAHISQLLPIKAMLMIIASDIHLKNKDINEWKIKGVQNESDFVNPEGKNVQNESKKYIKIATKDIENNKPWKYTSRVDSWVKTLSEIRLTLYILEERYKHLGSTKRGNRPSAGFPSHYMEPAKRFNDLGNDVKERKKLEEKSANRFKNTVIGIVKSDENGEIFDGVGALYSLGLIDFHIEENIENNKPSLHLYYALTREGYLFMNFENNLLNKLLTTPEEIGFDDLMQKFSKEEAEFFYRHTENNIDKEYEALENVIKYLFNIQNDSDLSPKEKAELSSIGKITENLTESIAFFEHMKRSSLVDPRKAYTSSLLNRWVGLNILTRPNRGKYGLNEKYIYLYKDLVINSYKPVRTQKKIENTMHMNIARDSKSYEEQRKPTSNKVFGGWRRNPKS